jgi:hypothetical protein
VAQIFSSGQENGFTFDRGGNNMIPQDRMQHDAGYTIHDTRSKTKGNINPYLHPVSCIVHPKKNVTAAGGRPAHLTKKQMPKVS